MISVIVPVMNEEENIEPLIREIVAVSKKVPVTEIIYVNDASTDNTASILKNMKLETSLLRVIHHNERAGQSAALRTGIKAASNDIIATIDGDGQNDPKDIERLYDADAFEASRRYGAPLPPVMIAGQRQKRNDNAIRRISSRIANNIRSGILKDGTRDTGCSLKMFRRSDYLNLPYFNHMHRFLPALMMREGIDIIHIDVSHRARQHGVSKYGTLDRLLVGIVDIFGVKWLQARASKPLVFEEV